jgi:hypothetical protein
MTTRRHPPLLRDRMRPERSHTKKKTDPNSPNEHSWNAWFLTLVLVATELKSNHEITQNISWNLWFQVLDLLKTSIQSTKAP